MRQAAIAQAETDSSTVDVINLSAGAYSLTKAAGGTIVLQDMASGVVAKTLLIQGQGEAKTSIQGSIGGGFRDFEVIGTASAGVTVVFKNLTITSGTAVDGGPLGGAAAHGGGILLDGGNVTLSNAAVSGNVAAGAPGAFGSGAKGHDAQGGGIYVAAGTLTALDAMIINNIAAGGAGGHGATGTIAGGGLSHGATGRAGAVGASGAVGADGEAGAPGGAGGPGMPGGDGDEGGAAHDNGDGSHGGDGGDGSGGGLYVAGGVVTLVDTTLRNNEASGGSGGPGEAPAVALS